MIPCRNEVFLRTYANGSWGEALAPGWRGEGRARDYVPSLVVTPDGVPWVAYTETESPHWKVRIVALD